MFFTNKDKAALQHHIECLYSDISFLKNQLEILTTRINALLKIYPHGIKKNGEPRNKAGRPRKVAV